MSSTFSSTPAPAVVIMAAGKGTRMNNPVTAKVMFSVGGRPMIDSVVEQALASGAGRIVVVIGHNREAVRQHLLEGFGNVIEFAEQIEQLGTGHAVMQAASLLAAYDGDVLVLSGDVPLLTSATINGLRRYHATANSVATVLTVRAPNPTGYGRVVRNSDGSVERIVEERDANEAERAIDEINSGIYIFRAADLFRALANLDTNNSQGEYYLTDVFGWFRANGMVVSAWTCEAFDEVQGINTVDQLAAADRAYRERAATLPQQ